MFRKIPLSRAGYLARHGCIWWHCDGCHAVDWVLLFFNGSQSVCAPLLCTSRTAVRFLLARQLRLLCWVCWLTIDIFVDHLSSKFVVANTQPRDARNCALSPGKQWGNHPVGSKLPVSIGNLRGKNLYSKMLKYIVSQNKPGLPIIPVSPGLYHGSTLL